MLSKVTCLSFGALLLNKNALKIEIKNGSCPNLLYPLRCLKPYFMTKPEKEQKGSLPQQKSDLK